MLFGHLKSVFSHEIKVKIIESFFSHIVINYTLLHLINITNIQTLLLLLFFHKNVL